MSDGYGRYTWFDGEPPAQWNAPPPPPPIEPPQWEPPSGPDQWGPPAAGPPPAGSLPAGSPPAGSPRAGSTPAGSTPAGSPQWGAPGVGSAQWGPPQGSDQWGPSAAGSPPAGSPPAGSPQWGPPTAGSAQPGARTAGSPQWGPPAAGPTQQWTQQYGPPIPPYQDGPQAWAQQPRRGRGRTLVAMIATGTAVVLTAGGVYAYTALSGGGAQLATRTPGDAVAYLEVNLDPPAAQKIAAIRFLRKFPEAKVGAETGSLLDSVVEPLIPDEKSRRLFAEDVKTWLGTHAAVAADPQSGTLRTVVLAETTDEAKTRAGLDRINAEQPNERSKVRYAIADGVVYLAETQQAADTAARDGGSATLDGNDTFGADVEKVGTDGIATFWTDLAAAEKYEQTSGSATQGRLAGSLRFTDTAADLRIHAFGNQARTGSQKVGARVATLPGDTAVAIGLSGGDQLVRNAYDQLDKAGLSRVLDKAERDSGLRLPDDLAALVGSSTVIALGGTGDQRGLGLVSTTDDQAAARRAADTLLRKVNPDSALTARSTADGIVLASSAAYADQLTANGDLGRTQLFTDSLPDLDNAAAVVYVDLAKAAEISGDELPPQVSALRSVGLTASSAGDESDVHLRLVAG
jgi:hypothetical protein